MELSKMDFLSGSIGREIKFKFYDLVNSRNVELDNDALPHPDLRKVFNELIPYFVGAIAPDSDLKDKFIPNKIKVSENKAEFFLTIYGKLNTEHDFIINASSGKIPIPSDSELRILVNTILSEFNEYFYNDKTAELKLPFDEKK